MGKGLMCTHHLMTSLGQINLSQYRQNHYLSKLMYFFFPESSYNEQTMKMLDVYYPRALQWFTIEQLPHEEIEEITMDKIFSRTNNTAISFSLVSTIITHIFTH